MDDDHCPHCASTRRIAEEAVIAVIDGCESAYDHLGGAEQSVWDGVRMVQNRAIKAARDLGMEPLGVSGETFDPHLHHAVETVPSPTPDLVERVLRLGWRDLETGQILRPAEVIVGMPEPAVHFEEEMPE